MADSGQAQRLPDSSPRVRAVWTRNNCSSNCSSTFPKYVRKNGWIRKGLKTKSAKKKNPYIFSIVFFLIFWFFENSGFWCFSGFKFLNHIRTLTMDCWHFAGFGHFFFSVVVVVVVFISLRRHRRKLLRTAVTWHEFQQLVFGYQNIFPFNSLHTLSDYLHTEGIVSSEMLHKEISDNSQHVFLKTIRPQQKFQMFDLSRLVY